MGNVFFDKAPIGDPNDKNGQKLLTVRLHPHAKPHEGMIQVHVTDTMDRDWILVDVPMGALVMVGFPAQGVDDAETMLAWLDKACSQMPDWRKQRPCIRPVPPPDADITITVDA